MEYFKSEKHIQNTKKASILGITQIRKLKEERIEEYYKNPKLCKQCGNPISYDKKNKKNFCNNSCSAKYNNSKRKISEEQKIKVSITLLNKNVNFLNENEVIRKCLNCYNEFVVKRLDNRRLSSQKYCSKLCSNLGMKKNLILTIGDKIKNGTHKGWSSRKIISYPEKFFMDVFGNKNLIYKHNFVISKRSLGLNDSSNYFLDFYFEDKKIDLEIDGKQHYYPDRKIKDDLRDELLQKIGIKVYRIKWKNPNCEDNKIYMENEINEFLKYYEKDSISYN